MSTAYEPTCPACRSNHPTEFHRNCDGCRVRQARTVAAATQRLRAELDHMAELNQARDDALKEIQ